MTPEDIVAFAEETNNSDWFHKKDHIKKELAESGLETRLAALEEFLR